MMFNVHRYQVFSTRPQALGPLDRLAHNLWWTWNRPARAIFARIDPVLYEKVSGNPILLLAQADQGRLDELAEDRSFLDALADVMGALDEYLGRETWFERTYGHAGLPENVRFGYFSMEFGIHECLPVYSGGLGVLAGDHLKAASDLGLPLVGVGVAFSEGYFRQSLDADGWQNERYPKTDWHDLPVSTVVDAQGAPVRVGVELPLPPAEGSHGAREVRLQAYRVDVGRVPLYLLDANLDENTPADRALTNTLYGGDRAHRIRQEILLGIGGVRLLEAIGIRPAVCHMNEGHSAFLALERARQIMQAHGASFAVAAEAAAAGNLFTTHTPVPAGNDTFGRDLVLPYLSSLGRGLGMRGEDVMRIGLVDPDNPVGDFSMPVIAIRMADGYNGVSVLHGREARAMWSVLWHGLPSAEVPIGSITNGIHIPTWLGDEPAELYAKALGPGFLHDVKDQSSWSRIEEIPDEALWAMHERCRAALVAEVRRRVRAARELRRQLPDPSEIETLLDPRALTIGFARRFATYKRATLLLRDPERLQRILCAPGRPVQLVFSGKAHPQDWGGKELIRDIVRASQSEAFRGRIAFIEDYDMGVARALVAGVDVWLNTPRRPLEASGTSGMKAGINGALQASVLDGWWPEAYAGDNGFAIGRGEEYSDPEQGDRVEAQALYRLLEEDIVPLFYERDDANIPRRFVSRMKRSIATIAPRFNTFRMVREYVETLYVPAALRAERLMAGELGLARSLAAWKERVAAAFSQVKILTVGGDLPERIESGKGLSVTADIHLGSISSSEVLVDLYYGKLSGEGSLGAGSTASMHCISDLGGGSYRFEGRIPTSASGEHAFGVRVIPYHEALADRYGMKLVRWY
jgi:starch phosphorylase